MYLLFKRQTEAHYYYILQFYFLVSKEIKHRVQIHQCVNTECDSTGSKQQCG